MSKSYTVLLSSILALFVCLLLMLCYFNRLATDDYYFIWDVRNHGIIKGVTSQYLEWCGRFAATFFMDIFYKWFDVEHTYYSFFPFLSALLLFSGLYTLLQKTCSIINLALTKYQTVLAAASFSALLFFLSIDIGESWFWFCGMSSYLWSIIAFIWGIAFLLNTKKSKRSLFASILCFIYIGGSSEVYSVIYGLLMISYLFYQYKKLTSLTVLFAAAYHKRLLIILIPFAISFLIFLVAPGNYLRDGLFPEHQFWYSFFITAKSFVKFGVFYLPLKLHYILIFTVPFLLLGNTFKEKQNKLFDTSFKSIFKQLSFAFVSVLFIFFLLVAYVMVETGPPRIWFLVSFLLSIYCSLIFFYAGYKGLLTIKQLRIIKNVSLVLGFCTLIFHLINHYSIASTYARANDERIMTIKELNEQITKDTLIFLDPLPPSGMLYSTEIASDTSHFTNKELRLGYNLKFHIALRK